MSRTAIRVVWGMIWSLLPLRGVLAEEAGRGRDSDTARGNRMIANYFRAETARLSGQCLSGLKTLEDWQNQRPELHRELREMLGLDPWPEKSPLNPVVTGQVEHDEFVVEKLHFQSRPGLYVTGNLYRPKERSGPLPAILYVCGHGGVKENGISYGNKTHYQHHGAWFARNGYVCLTIDTVQLGEIEGVHHGTYKLGQWWWNARGYTPAGVEAWNGIRALDYLQSRPEVDGEKLGVTGRSGGGAYSWWIAALDDRVKVAVPVAGITDLENHVVGGVVEGHCDCMFLVNTYEWDYPQVAALVAPRPLLISNTDKDSIFPLEGVVRVHEKVRDVYRLYGADKNLGLQITEGGHHDTQELHIHAFRWFNRFLKGDSESQITKPAVKFFAPAQLRVFDELPADEINTKIQESFVPVASVPEVPKSADEWTAQRDTWLAALRNEVFRVWPDGPEAEKPPAPREVFSAESDGVRLTAYDFTSQDEIELRLYVLHRAGLKSDELDLVVLNALDQRGWDKWLAAMRPAFAKQLAGESLPEPDQAEWDQTRKMLAAFKWGMAYVAPRGIGRSTWNPNEKKQAQIRRRFQLLGQTLDGMRVWDTRRAVQSLRAVEGFSKVPLWLQGERQMAAVALYASLFEPEIARLDLWNLPATHLDGPDLLNVLRFMDLPQTLTIAAERSQIRLYETSPTDWHYALRTAKQLGWGEKRLQVRAMLVDPEEAADK